MKFLFIYTTTRNDETRIQRIDAQSYETCLENIKDRLKSFFLCHGYNDYCAKFKLYELKEDHTTLLNKDLEGLDDWKRDWLAEANREYQQRQEQQEREQYFRLKVKYE